MHTHTAHTHTQRHAQRPHLHPEQSLPGVSVVNGDRASVWTDGSRDARGLRATNKVTPALAAMDEDTSHCELRSTPASICAKTRILECLFGQKMRVSDEKSALLPTPGNVFNTQHLTHVCARHEVLVGLLFSHLSRLRSQELRSVPRQTLFSVLRKVDKTTCLAFWQLQLL